MKIWLDDCRPAPAGFIHVRNKAELEKLLADRTEAIEEMWFDHDLGDNEPTGYDIVKWLAENHLDRWPQAIGVHSQNPVGRENIRSYVTFVLNRMLGEKKSASIF